MLSAAGVMLIGCDRRREPSDDTCDDDGRSGRCSATSPSSAVAAPYKPLQHLFTLNSHGTYSEETFALPADVYVLVPHPMGLDVPYTLNSPPDHVTFEEMLYQQPAGLIPLPSSGAWHLYKPGDVIRNLSLRPWSRSSDTRQEYDSWVQGVPSEDRAYVVTDARGTIPELALVPARGSTRKAIEYEGIRKLKVKIFGPTTLDNVVRQVQRQTSMRPIILAPFTCNDKPATDGIAINIDSSRTGPFPE